MSANERLQELAAIAANYYIEDKIPLNVSIAKLRDKYSLKNEEVKRVCEYANRNVFLHLFQNATGDKIIEFPLADYKQIIKSKTSTKEIKKKASDQTNLSYVKPTISNDYHLSCLDHTEFDAYMQEGSKALERQRYIDFIKKASEQQQESFDHLQLAEEKSRQQYNVALYKYTEALAELKKQAYDELHHTPLEHVLYALAVSTDSKFAGDVLAELKPIVDDLSEREFIKRASITTYEVPNDEHPLIQAFKRAVKYRGELVKSAVYLKKASLAKKAGVAKFMLWTVPIGTSAHLTRYAISHPINAWAIYEAGKKEKESLATGKEAIRASTVPPGPEDIPVDLDKMKNTY